MRGRHVHVFVEECNTSKWNCVRDRVRLSASQATRYLRDSVVQMQRSSRPWECRMAVSKILHGGMC